MTASVLRRRDWLRRAGALAGGGSLAALGACSSPSLQRARVLVVGGGWGGATAAKYLRLLSDQTLDVTLVEPNRAFLSCPGSNQVLSGQRSLANLTSSYDDLARRHGVHVVHDHIDRIDLAQKTARLTGGATLRWDKLLLAPGIDFDWAATEGLQTAHGAGRALHAWRAGPETLALRSQLEAMPDGGVFAISIPEAPYRCPPGPYERACMVAAYFRRSKPRSKVLILDANAEITSKAALFRKAWAELYPGMIEHWPLHRLMAVDGARRTLRFESHPDVQADVLNVLPVMRAGVLAQQTGLVNSNARWCQVHWLNFESTAARDLHLVGDALQGAQGMPKSAHMASSQAKVAAAAIVAELNGWAVDPQPMLSNVCLSLVDDTQAIHVASVHEYLADRQSFFPVAGSGGLSAERSVLEARYAEGWLRNIRADTLG